MNQPLWFNIETHIDTSSHTQLANSFDLVYRPSSGQLYKNEVIPRTGHEGPEGEQIHSSTPRSTSALDGAEW